MDRKVFLAVSLCAAIFLIWNQYYLKPISEKQQTYLQQQSQQVITAPPGESTPRLREKKAEVTRGDQAEKSPVNELREISIGSTNYGVSISTRGGVVRTVKMAEYRGQNTDKVERLIGGRDALELSSPSPDFSYISNVIYSVEKQDLMNLVLSYDDANISIQRTYTVNPELYSVNQDVAFKFKKQRPNYIYVGLKAAKQLPKSDMENERRQIFLNKSGGQDSWQVADIDEVKEDQGQANWVGFASRYFLNAILNRHSVVHPQFQARPASTDEIAAGLFYPVSANDFTIPITMYFGPKDIEVLKRVGNRLDSAVDFGWFTVFAYPMLTALKWFYKYVHNFGIAIILLTVLVKLLTYPLTLKSMRSMKQMQRIQPQLQRLRERHKDDKERLNKEMLQLMRANGYNPMSGCLPIFIQMPIFVALYNVLYGAIDLYGQPFFGWIHDLSAKDPFYVTPILLALMMFIQQKMTPNTASDPAQQRMMMMMPVIFGFMMLWLPSGLTLYMLVNSIVSVIQQLLINRSLGGSNASAAA